MSVSVTPPATQQSATDPGPQRYRCVGMPGGEGGASGWFRGCSLVQYLYFLLNMASSAPKLKQINIATDRLTDRRGRRLMDG